VKAVDKAHRPGRLLTVSVAGRNETLEEVS
jgi:hypothetical protein